MDIIRQMVVDALVDGKTPEEIAAEISKAMNAGVNDYKEIEKEVSKYQKKDDYVDGLVAAIHEDITNADFGDDFLTNAWMLYISDLEPDMTAEELSEMETMVYDLLKACREIFDDEEDSDEDPCADCPISCDKQEEENGWTDEIDEELVKKFLNLILSD